jgi:hypothetical protein
VEMGWEVFATGDGELLYLEFRRLKVREILGKGRSVGALVLGPGSLGRENNAKCLETSRAARDCM